MKFSLPSVQSLLEKAAEQAAFSCSDKEVVYCYLTLRPIAIGHSGIVQCTSADIVRGGERRGGEGGISG